MDTSSRGAASPGRAGLLKVAFVHVGPPNHGVLRYGRILAAEAARRGDVQVEEVELPWRPHGLGLSQLVSVARQLRSCHVIHIQYNVQRDGCVWGPGWLQFARLAVFLTACRRPIVCTVHDIYPTMPLSAVTRAAGRVVASIVGRWAVAIGLRGYASPRSTRGVGSRINEIRRTLGNSGMSLQLLGARAHRLFVCTQEERQHLSIFLPTASIRLVPHFIEERPSLPSASDARKHVGLCGKRIITLLGYIHARKGHRFAVEALARLPEDCVLVFAGSAANGNEPFLAGLIELARELGVGERLHVTGFLSEAELGLYLAATDVPICPFARVAASGSLSTWLSAGRGVLASDVPLAREYNALSADAIRVFSPHTPEALAEAIDRFGPARPRADAAAIHLRRVLAAPAIAAAHTRQYMHLRPGDGASSGAASERP